MSYTDGIILKLPDVEEIAARTMFKQAVNLNTIAIYCPDPRANGIPAAVAREFGDVWPGESIRDENGVKVAATTTLGSIITVGGRAVDALRSVMTLHHMLGLNNIAVVHHTYCGTTAFTPEGLIAGYRHEHHSDVAGLYHDDDLCIADFEESLRRDVAMIRAAPGTPRRINIYGFVYDINVETLTKLITDPGVQAD